MQLAQELITIFSGSPCRVDAQLETPRGAISLAEYGRGETPLLLHPVVRSLSMPRDRNVFEVPARDPRRQKHRRWSVVANREKPLTRN